jgi:aldose 1-epimerase
VYQLKNYSKNQQRFITVFHTAEKVFAKISLDQGASLQELSFGKTQVIKKQPNFEYKDSYASSILFPFCSRIENGAYEFEGKKEVFHCNESGEKNALHGLIYNKKFDLISQNISDNFVSITLGYFEKIGQKGFPYKYDFYVTYTFSENGLALQIIVKNEDESSFPFTLGWHPYFLSDDLPNSFFQFESHQKVVFNEQLIAKGVTDLQTKSPFSIDNHQFDDCFILNTPITVFKTPTYDLTLNSNSKEHFLQIYTPKGLPIVAIEPMTGISNSFNNQIGLQVLAPAKIYSITWNLSINQKNESL